MESEQSDDMLSVILLVLALVLLAAAAVANVATTAMIGKVCLRVLSEVDTGLCILSCELLLQDDINSRKQ